MFFYATLQLGIALVGSPSLTFNRCQLLCFRKKIVQLFSRNRAHRKHSNCLYSNTSLIEATTVDNSITISTVVGQYSVNMIYANDWI